MKNEDLNPETQEKLLQFQKYQDQQLRDPVPQTLVSTTRKRLFSADNLSSESEPPIKKSEQDDSGYFYIFIYIYIYLIWKKFI